MPYTYEYPRAGLDRGLRRLRPGRRGPEGHADPARTGAVQGQVGAARRVRARSTRRSTTPRGASCEEETGLRDVFLEQLYTFGAVDRDPRERVVTSRTTRWSTSASTRSRPPPTPATRPGSPSRDAPSLAFDHDADPRRSRCERLRGKVRYQPIGFELLPPKFTLSQLQRLYETRARTPARQAQLPQEDPLHGPARRDRRGRAGRRPPRRAALPLRRAQIQTTCQAGIQLRAMKAVIQSSYGPAEKVLSVQDVAKPVPNDDEVLVRFEPRPCIRTCGTCSWGSVRVAVHGQRSVHAQGDPGHRYRRRGRVGRQQRHAAQGRRTRCSASAQSTAG